MTSRPPSFSITEPAAVMLNRLRDDQGIIKTIKLPKGPASSASPGRSYSMPTPTSAGPDNISSQIGDNHHAPAELRDLQGWSVIDLLEADERPTFIIDLADRTNFGSGPLKVIYENPSLRASQGIHELITQNPDDNNELSRFKAWAVSLVRDNRSMDVCLPSLSYGGISWTCSTLGDRFRFISGNSSAVSITPTSPASPARASSLLERRSRGATISREPIAPGKDRTLGNFDYFGNLEPDPHDGAGRRSHSVPCGSDDMRPDTPVIQSKEPIDIDIDVDDSVSNLAQTSDWTRIVDISGTSLSLFFFPLSPPLQIPSL